MNKVSFRFKDNAIGQDFYYSKRHLFECFFGDFYEFIKKKNENDLIKHNIHSKEDFYAFADWNAEGMNNCYAMGFAFHPYFLEVDERDEVPVLEKVKCQSDKCFFGYCLKNGKYLDFINFLLSFFPYWRNDETCTRFDPYNKGDQFFNSSWAVLVDTCKLFYFDSETVFHWITFRIKYVVDNIPGTIKGEFKDDVCYSGTYVLPRLRVSGYEFLSWQDKDGNDVKEVSNKDITVYANLKRKDFYTYWETEEPKIIKVKDPNYKKIDPC